MKRRRVVTMQRGNYKGHRRGLLLDDGCAPAGVGESNLTGYSAFVAGRQDSSGSKLRGVAIFDGDEEVEGWVLGRYSDFGAFRDHIAKLCGHRFPTLQESTDCDSTWTPDDAARLRQEL